jgi:hypothetical protein
MPLELAQGMDTVNSGQLQWASKTSWRAPCYGMVYGMGLNPLDYEEKH